MEKLLKLYMYMLMCGQGEITEAVHVHADVCMVKEKLLKLCMYMLTCGQGEITEAVHVHADVWSRRNY